MRIGGKMLRTRLTRRGDRRNGRSRKAVSVVSLVLLATAAFGQTYTASVFAGVWLPENLPGVSVSLNEIGGVAVDAAGNVFLSLPTYAAVMRLDATTGILTRVAGNGTNGFSGDNGPAVNAQLYGPSGLALDRAGNLYIADTINGRIRKVMNGIITTVPGAEGYFAGIAADSVGNLYLVDSLNQRVFEVSNGVATIFA